MEKNYKEAAEVLRNPVAGLKVITIDGEPEVGLSHDYAHAIEVALDALEHAGEQAKKYAAAIETAAIATELAAAARKADGDLISRTALLTEIEENPWSIDIEELKAILEYVPVVEAEPVVHAHWERFKHPSGTHGIRCSHCKTVDGMRAPFCRYCGAHMDEEVADGTSM